MKKILATLSAAAVLFTCLACGIALTAAAETSSQYTTAAYLDFSNAQAQAAAEAAADLSGTPGKTFTADAVYSRSSGGGAVGPMLDIKFKQNIPMSIGSVLAFKVKLDYAEQKLQKVYWRTTGSYTSLGDMTISTQYAAHTDWQLVMIPLNSDTLYKEHKAMTESYTQLRIELAQGAGRTTDYTYISWVGVFKSEADAMAHYALTTPEPVTLFDFSTTQAQTTAKANATISIPGENATAESLGGRSSSGGTVGPQIELKFKQSIPMDAGSVLAFKVKLNNAEQKLQKVYWATTGSYANYGDMTISTQYAAHTDWQLVMIPLNSDTLYKEHKAMTESYTKLKIELAQAPGHTNDYIYIGWVGIFESEAEAQALYKITTPNTTPFYYDFTTQQGADYSNAEALGKMYSEEYGALGTRSNAAGTAGPFVKLAENSRYAYAAGQVFAVKLKLTDVNSKVQSLKMDMVNSGTVTIDVSDVTYAATTDWQLLLIELDEDAIASWTGGSKPTYSYPWKNVNLVLDTGKSPAESNFVYIAWLGIFDNEKSALAHYNDTTDNSVEAVGAKINESGSALRFGFNMTASGVTYAADDSYEAAPLTAASTMIIDGVKRQIVDFGAVLKMTSASTFDENALTYAAGIAGNSSIKAVKAEKLYSIDGNDITYIMTVTNAGEYANYYVHTRAYVAYLDGNGQTQYIYSNMKTSRVADFAE